MWSFPHLRLRSWRLQRGLSWKLPHGWLYVTKCLAIRNKSETATVKCLFVVAAWYQPLAAKTLGKHSAQLSYALLRKVKDNIKFESFMELHKTPLSSSSELFPCSALKVPAEKLNQVLYNEVIQSAVTIDKGHKKPAKRAVFPVSMQEAVF